MNGSGHLDNWELLALLRVEGSPEQETRWRSHIDTCSRCARRTQRLRRRLDHVSRALATLSDDTHGSIIMPLPVQSTRRRRAFTPFARAAAVVLLLVAVLAAAPVRAVLREWITTAWRQLEGGPENGSVAHTAPPSEPPLIRFVPAAEILDIEIAARQTSGSLVLRTTTERTVRLSVIGSSADAAPIIGASAIRIHNTATDTASYDVAVPASVRTVRLRIGTAPQRTIDSARLGTAIAFDLQKSQ